MTAGATTGCRKEGEAHDPQFTSSLSHLTMSGLLRSVRIKGGRDDDAVLCTSDKTFTLRLAESSNTCLLGPRARTKRQRPDNDDDGEAMEVQTAISSHLEIIRSAPRTGKLRTLLAARPYSGGEAASADGETPRRLTLAELESTVQASTAELRVALRDSRALCVDGGWCVLDAQLELDAMECVVALCVERGWALSSVPVAECVAGCLEQAPDGFDETVIRHCLRCHSTLAEAEWDEWLGAMDAATLSLAPPRLCRFRARAMLAECDAWPKAHFLAAWQDGLPAGVELDLTQLAGLAIFLPSAAPSALTGSSSSGPSTAEADTLVQSLPLASLPLAPKERFAALFAVKPHWSIDELNPYTADILMPGKKPESIVLQFGRSVYAADGTVTYVNKPYAVCN